MTIKTGMPFVVFLTCYSWAMIANDVHVFETPAALHLTNDKNFPLCPLINPDVIRQPNDWSDKEIKCDWGAVDTSVLYFPSNFLLGGGYCEYQGSGAENCPDAQWAHFEKQKGKSWLGNDVPTIEDDARSGRSDDFWHTYKSDIVLMDKELGFNTFRTSIEWSKIEPVEGQFNRDAIEHYHDLFNELHAHNITPMITLHHFAHPQWFEEKGGFQEASNIHYFVRFCKKMFEEYRDQVSLWITINEPGVLAFQGPFRGVYPHTKRGIYAVGELMRNLMQAHVDVYRAIKSMPGGDKAQVGIVHDIVQYEPYHQELCNPLRWIESGIASNINYLFHAPITEFLITKKFSFSYFPFINIAYEVDKNERILDFIGLNYYSHVLFDILPPYYQHSAYRADDIPTDMPYGLYPEGLYRAIDTVSKMGVPIYITENGLADAKDDRRGLFLKRYLYVVSQAIKAGYDIRGYYYWSVMDNFEWDMGLYGRRYGLYEVDYTTLKRTLRPSAHYFIDVIKTWKEKKEQVF